MNKENFKKAVYELAEFNSNLKKGYRKELSESDLIGYAKKNKELKRLIGIAVEKGYPVYHDKRQQVVYFIFGKVQISFHTGTDYSNQPDFGLKSTSVEWDGVRNAHKYSEKEYVRLKNERKKELARRKAELKKKENQLKKFCDNHVVDLEKILKIVHSDKSKAVVSDKIKKLKTMTMYGLVEYCMYNFDKETKILCMEIKKMYEDSYIHDFAVG